MSPEQQLAKEIRTAIKAGDRQFVAELLGTDKARINTVTPFGTWLHVAAAHGRLDIVELLCSLGADVNRSAAILGGTALNEAASEGHLNIVKYLLLKGAAMDVTDPRKNPLFGAIHGGHTAVAKLLIENGIDTERKYTGEQMKNMDALAFAREWGRKDIEALLLACS